MFSLLLPCFQSVHFILCPLVNIFVPLSLSLISLPAALPLIMSYQPNTSLCSIIINFIPLGLSPLLLCFPHTVPSFNFCLSHLFLLPFWSFHQSSFFCSFFFITFHTTQQTVIPGVNVRGDHVKGRHVCLLGGQSHPWLTWVLMVANVSSVVCLKLIFWTTFHSLCDLFPLYLSSEFKADGVWRPRSSVKVIYMEKSTFWASYKCKWNNSTLVNMHGRCNQCPL